MKSTLFKYALSICLLLFSSAVKSTVLEDNREFEKVSREWFSAWELVCNFYGIDHIKPVDFLLFDDNYVYSTSQITTEKGTATEGPHLMNLKLKWKKALHHGSITLPDSSVVPVGIMSFAAANKNGSIPFFVMPLPSYWSSSGVESKELGLEKLVTGIFLHEFTHTQQMQNFGEKITLYETKTNFNEDFDDDIVQRIFKHDSIYMQSYKEEIRYFDLALKSDEKDKTDIINGLRLMDLRHKQFFIGKYAQLKDIEELFLTMEGLGQYSMYIWLTHPDGANITRDVAIQGVRRNRKWWSQDQGFSTFLLLEQFTQPKSWAKNMFGKDIFNVVDLLRNAIAQ